MSSANNRLPRSAGVICPAGNALGQRLSQGTFADARLPQQAWIIFLAAAENFNHPVQLGLPAEHRVQPPLLRQAG